MFNIQGIIQNLNFVSCCLTDAADSTEKFCDFAVANRDIITKMADHLDQKSRIKSNWFDLGQQFNLSAERLNEIEYVQFTQVLMEYLYVQNPDLTIGTFYQAIKKLNRLDVLKKLDPYIVGEFEGNHSLNRHLLAGNAFKGKIIL